MSVWLRRAGTLGEVLHLSNLANHAVRELLRESPDDHALLVALSESWHYLGKIHWDLRQFEDALTDCRNAVDAQRRALALAPTSAGDRDELGWRLIQLGRKQCELGRLDEAEASFAERQALWPGEIERHAQAVRELRKWAAEVAEVKDGLPPEASQQRQRYLELCSRLERAWRLTRP